MGSGSQPLRGGLLCLCAFATQLAFITFGPLALSETVVTLYCPARASPCGLLPTCGRPLHVGRWSNLEQRWGPALLSKFSAGLLFFCFLVFIFSLRYWQLPGMPSEYKAELRAWRRRHAGMVDQRHAVGCVAGVLHLFRTPFRGINRQSFVLCHSQLSCLRLHFSRSQSPMPIWIFSARVLYISGHGQQAYFHPYGAECCFPPSFSC